jgi:hypothetical protein
MNCIENLLETASSRCCSASCYRRLRHLRVKVCYHSTVCVLVCVLYDKVYLEGFEGFEVCVCMFVTLLYSQLLPAVEASPGT